MKRIKLTQGKYALVDDELFCLLNKYRWYFNKGYARRKVEKEFNNASMSQFEFMHHYVIGRPIGGMVVDHLNGNSVDNRRCNLKVVTVRQNQLNRKAHRNGRLFGCRWHKRDRKWLAEISVDGRQMCIGRYDSEELAHHAYMNELEIISREDRRKNI